MARWRGRRWVGGDGAVAVAMARWRWSGGDGAVTMAGSAMSRWRWRGGDGAVAMARWRWRGGDGAVAMARWRWRGGDGAVAVRLSVSPSVRLSVSPSICPSILQSIHLSVCHADRQPDRKTDRPNFTSRSCPRAFWRVGPCGACKVLHVNMCPSVSVCFGHVFFYVPTRPTCCVSHFRARLVRLRTGPRAISFVSVCVAPWGT
jgi:hypothetical protein